ncbi:MAG: DUF86 domain-containing protein [candidate division KSB1 bacterium]|nr:DUF86 domain-containing protein [candidate division KSB1 bacterium]
MRTPEERLQDILEAIASIKRYSSQGRTAFDEAELIQVWMVHHLQIIGEAASSLPDSLIRLYPEVPWAQIIAFRNIVVHEYFHLSLNLIWSIVVNDLPTLEEQIQGIQEKLVEEAINE